LTVSYLIVLALLFRVPGLVPEQTGEVSEDGARQAAAAAAAAAAGVAVGWRAGQRGAGTSVQASAGQRPRRSGDQQGCIDHQQGHQAATPQRARQQYV